MIEIKISNEGKESNIDVNLNMESSEELIEEVVVVIDTVVTVMQKNCNQKCSKEELLRLLTSILIYKYNEVNENTLKDALSNIDKKKDQ